jgi:RNA polymerase sigma-70 factor (ECF subfamily)
LEIAQSFIAFIESNQERFFRITFTYVKNTEDALDIVHNAIVKALQKQHTLRKQEYLQTWFYRILINECITFLRKTKKTISIDDLTDFEVPADDSDQNEYIDLYRAIEKLPVHLKTIVILRYFEDMKLDEIAEITSTNLSTTKSRLYKALEILKIDMEVIEND